VLVYCAVYFGSRNKQSNIIELSPTQTIFYKAIIDDWFKDLDAVNAVYAIVTANNKTTTDILIYSINKDIWFFRKYHHLGLSSRHAVI
jgi:hypothetical protein